MNLSVTKIGPLQNKALELPIWSHYGPTDPDGPGWTPYNKPCHTFYQTLSHLVTDFITRFTRLCHTLYQTLSHLLPDFVTPFSKPCHTLCHTLSHLVPDFVTPCTRLFHTLHPTLSPSAKTCPTF